MDTRQFLTASDDTRTTHEWSSTIHVAIGTHGLPDASGMCQMLEAETKGMSSPETSSDDTRELIDAHDSATVSCPNV